MWENRIAKWRGAWASSRDQQHDQVSFGNVLRAAKLPRLNHRWTACSGVLRASEWLRMDVRGSGEGVVSCPLEIAKKHQRAAILHAGTLAYRCHSR